MLTEVPKYFGRLYPAPTIMDGAHRRMEMESTAEWITADASAWREWPTRRADDSGGVHVGICNAPTPSVTFASRDSNRTWRLFLLTNPDSSGSRYH
jgi:hypothetical protein